MERKARKDREKERDIEKEGARERKIGRRERER
jgi:hypothetical protein